MSTSHSHIKARIGQYLQRTGLLKDPLAPNRILVIRSAALKRKVRVDVFLPPEPLSQADPTRTFPVVFFNDGQDLRAVQLKATLRRLILQKEIEPLIAVGFHAGDRLQEYGVIHHPDYLKRGSRAEEYAYFLTHEFMPRFKRDFPVDPAPQRHAFAGFSLGALSAFDLVWNHPHLFGKAGIFSGALWWRAKAFREEDPDADRILHQLVKTGEKRPGLKFWFQAGTEDETSDRNKNGVIDSIDDTLDLIRELKAIGYPEGDITYVEVAGGKHEQQTWGQVMPDFLKWAFPFLPAVS
ncbi:MAG: esterase family protein [Saprospirales bacterium]|nr:esterase family protein [Saprospirales bacterium]